MNSIASTALLALGLAVAPLFVREGQPSLASLGFVGACFVVGGVLAGKMGPVAVGGLFFLAQVAATLDSRSNIEWWVVAYATGLFVLLDIAAGTIERRRRLPGGTGPQILRIAALSATAAAVVGVVLLIAKLPFESGVLMQAAGVGAVAALLLGLAHLLQQNP